MPKYRVILSYDATEMVNVVADSAETALEAAYDKASANLCHYCANRLELGDINGALVNDENGDTVLTDGTLEE